MTEDLETSIENTEFEFSKSNNTSNEEQKITKKRKITIKKTEKTSEVDQDIIEKLKTYVEPIYSNGITKTERFDEDNIKPLLRDIWSLYRMGLATVPFTSCLRNKIS